MYVVTFFSQSIFHVSILSLHQDLLLRAFHNMTWGRDHLRSLSLSHSLCCLSSSHCLIRHNESLQLIFPLLLLRAFHMDISKLCHSAAVFTGEAALNFQSCVPLSLFAVSITSLQSNKKTWPRIPDAREFFL